VLDADLTLTPAGPRAALLQLAGVYRARSGEAGHRVATVTIGGFLPDRRDYRRYRIGPTGTQVPAETALRP
jgi:hypothetical protein